MIGAVFGLLLGGIMVLTLGWLDPASRNSAWWPSLPAGGLCGGLGGGVGGVLGSRRAN
jgi:hypothetical protein